MSNFLNGKFNYEFLLEESIQKGEGLPLYVDIHPSGQCNQSCRWCIGIKKKMPACFLSEDKMVGIIDEIRELGVRCVVFDGFYGDPLLNKYTIESIYKAIFYKMSVGLGTNGLLLQENIMSVLVDLEYIRISLDSYDNEVYNSLKGVTGNNVDQIVRNVDYLIQLKRRLNKRNRIGISFMLQQENIGNIMEVSELSKKLGVDYIQFKVALGERNDFDLLEIRDQIENSKRKYSDEKFSIFSDLFVTDKRFSRCFAPYFIPVIGPDGNVYTCCECTGRSDRSYGNVYEERLSDIWFGQRKNQLVEKIDSAECEICSRHNWRINNFVNRCIDERCQRLKDEKENRACSID